MLAWHISRLEALNARLRIFSIEAIVYCFYLTSLLRCLTALLLWLQVDYLMNGLVMLKEHVDDTEDLINIELDNRYAESFPLLAYLYLYL